MPAFISTLKRLMNAARGIRVKRRERSMRLCETLSLGDRRYLALVAVDQQKFLVGAAGNSISLLARLPFVDGKPATLNSEEPFDLEDYKTWQ